MDVYGCGIVVTGAGHGIDVVHGLDAPQEDCARAVDVTMLGNSRTR